MDLHFLILKIIAKSFARIFYRNAFNVGLPVMVCPELIDETDSGDVLDISFESGSITNLTKGKKYHAEPIPLFMQDIIRHGGLMEYVTARRKS